MTAEDDNDAGAAFDRAAARAARRSGWPYDRFQWMNEHRYRAAVGRLVLVVVLLVPHVLAVRAVTVWLIAHFVVVAILASQVAKRWLARSDTGPLPK